MLFRSREIIEGLDTQSEEKCQTERDDSITIASLKASLSLEEEYRVSLEERLDSIDESNDLIIAKIIKERDHAIEKYKVLKK